MRKRISLYTAALTMAFGAAFSTQAAAATVPSADDESHIAIVNGYDAPVRVLAEDATGAVHEVAVLRPGEVRTVETADGAAVRLHAQPTNSKTRLSTWGDLGIKTDVLDLRPSENAIFWLAEDLGASLVEIRAS